MKVIKFLFVPIFAFVFPMSSYASLIYNDWTTNENGSGSYIVTVDENAGDLYFNVTVDPWDAEVLGIFFDLGDLDITGATSISDVTTAPGASSVSLYAVDSANNGCGPGCNLNGGLNPPVSDPDGEWEMVFRLGAQGSDNVQSWSWTFAAANMDFSLNDFGLAGVRAQDYCVNGGTILTANCSGSDKSYGTSTPTTTPVPLPGTLALLGIGLVAGGSVKRRRLAKEV